MAVQYHVINVGKQTMKPVSVDTREKCSAMTGFKGHKSRRCFNK